MNRSEERSDRLSLSLGSLSFPHPTLIPYAPQGEAERSVAVTRVAGEPPAGSRRGADMKEDNNIARISFFIHILFLFIIGISFILII